MKAKKTDNRKYRYAYAAFLYLMIILFASCTALWPINVLFCIASALVIVFGCVMVTQLISIQ